MRSNIRQLNVNSKIWMTKNMDNHPDKNTLKIVIRAADRQASLLSKIDSIHRQLNYNSAFFYLIGLFFDLGVVSLE